MAFEPDPFSQIYAAIYQIVAKWPGMLNATATPQQNGVVQVGRFVNLLEPVPRTQGGNSAAETPDMVLVQGSHLLNPHGRNSLVASITQDYILAISDNKEYLSRLNRAKWQAFSALKNAPCNLGLDFVTGWQLLGGSDGMGPSRFIRAAERKWNTATTIRVQADIPSRLI